MIIDTLKEAREILNNQINKSENDSSKYIYIYLDYGYNCHNGNAKLEIKKGVQYSLFRSKDFNFQLFLVFCKLFNYSNINQKIYFHI